VLEHQSKRKVDKMNEMFNNILQLKASTKCYLYIISAGTSFKVGVANDVLKRISQLQTGNPVEIKEEFRAEFKSDKEAYTAEEEIHSFLTVQGFHIIREWFSDIDMNQILLIIKKSKGISTPINKPVKSLYSVFIEHSKQKKTVPKPAKKKKKPIKKPAKKKVIKKIIKKDKTRVFLKQIQKGIKLEDLLSKVKAYKSEMYSIDKRFLIEEIQKKSAVSAGTLTAIH